jgi:hypothetical protein
MSQPQCRTSFNIARVARGAVVPMSDSVSQLLPVQDAQRELVLLRHIEAGFWFDPILRFWRQRKCGWSKCHHEAAVHIWAPNTPISVLLCRLHGRGEVVRAAAERRGSDLHIDSV